MGTPYDHASSKEPAMKILFLDQFGSLGGGQQILLELVRAVQKLGWKTQVLIPNGDCAQALQEQQSHVIPFTEWSFTQKKKSFWDFIKLFAFSVTLLFKHRSVFSQADMLCANGGRMYLMCFLASLLYAKPAVYYLHLDLGKLEYKFLQYILQSKHTKAIVAPSLFIKQRLLEQSTAFADDRVCVVENGLDSRFDSLPYRDNFTHSEIQHVGIIGHIHHLKGQDVFLQLAVRFPSLHFHLFGDATPFENSYYQHLQTQAPKNIHFHGWVQDLPSKICELPLQIGLVPSRCHESFSLVTLQMTALSCLVLVRNLGALEGLAKTLDLLTFNDDEQLEGMLSKILSTPNQEIAQQVAQSYTKAVERYSYSSFQERLQQFFLTLRG